MRKNIKRKGLTEMNLDLSVIVPVYNVEKYLEQCVKSIIEQTYKHLEIILVDDGSVDSSGSLCDLFSEIDKRVKVIHKNNGGLISARYTGLIAATSEYITFVDSDDWIKPNMYKELMRTMLETDVDVVTSGCIRYWDEFDWKESKDDIIGVGFYNRQMLETYVVPKMLWCEECNNWAVDPSLCTKIFKREILLKLYEPIKKCTFYFGEDTAILYPYILNASSVYVTHDCYYFHRQRARGIFAPYITSDDFFDNLHELYRYLKNVFLVSKQREVLMEQLDCFYSIKVNMHNLKYSNRTRRDFAYLFPFDKVPKGSNIVIYGAGRVGREYSEQLKKVHFCKVVLWVDKNHSVYGNGIDPIQKISEVKYDYLVIANASKEVRGYIAKELVELGVLERSIVI